ncbi:MAG: NAD-binding protein [Prochloraceae cyanobacterium]
MANSSQVKLDFFVVCGLGSLGQHCVAALNRFGVRTVGIEKTPPRNWEIPNLEEEFLEELIVGDCRQISILKQARIKHCRAALIATTNELVNIETAIAVRQLNPDTRLVIRSNRENINQLLGEQLGNFIAFDTAELSSPALALAALDDDTLGYFNLDGQWLQVRKLQIDPKNPWCSSSRLHEIENHRRKILTHARLYNNRYPSLHQWEQDKMLLAGDTIVVVETVEQLSFKSRQQSAVPSRRQKKILWKKIIEWHEFIRNFSSRCKQQVSKFWQLSFQQQVRRVTMISGIILLLILVMGTLLYRSYYPGISFPSAFYNTCILLFGGFGDLFSDLNQNYPIPWWLKLFSLGVTLTGTAFIAVIHALLTEALLSSKFEFKRSRPPIPQKDHIVIVGLDRICQRVATLLKKYKQNVLGININPNSDQTILPDMPLIVGEAKEALTKANLSTAKSVVVITDNEMENLEIALMARNANPKINLALRTYGQTLSNYLAEILPGAQALCTCEIAAKAFAGAAFGENIINLFRLKNRTILVTEYRIEPGDTLNGFLLADIAYGYGVIPILHQKPATPSTFMPSDDIFLQVGERLIILATTGGLRRIEQGQLNCNPKSYQVLVQKALTPAAKFEGANAIARITGCSLNLARELMSQLPETLPVFLYKQQGQRLVRELSKSAVVANLVTSNSNKKKSGYKNYHSTWI